MFSQASSFVSPLRLTAMAAPRPTAAPGEAVPSPLISTWVLAPAELWPGSLGPGTRPLFPSERLPCRFELSLASWM